MVNKLAGLWDMTRWKHRKQAIKQTNPKLIRQWSKIQQKKGKRVRKHKKHDEGWDIWQNDKGGPTNDKETHWQYIHTWKRCRKRYRWKSRYKQTQRQEVKYTKTHEEGFIKIKLEITTLRPQTTTVTWPFLPTIKWLGPHCKVSHHPFGQQTPESKTNDGGELVVFSWFVLNKPGPAQIPLYQYKSEILWCTVGTFIVSKVSYCVFLPTVFLDNVFLFCSFELELFISTCCTFFLISFGSHCRWLSLFSDPFHNV